MMRWTCGYVDHQVIFSPYISAPEADTIDGIVRMNEPDYTSASPPIFL